MEIFAAGPTLFGELYDARGRDFRVNSEGRKALRPGMLSHAQIR